MIILSLIMMIAFALPQNGNAQNIEQIKLPTPQKTGGKPLMEALNERKSQRQFSEKDLSSQMLSNLLWAANGINRIKSSKCTAPSAMNCQEIDTYVSMKQGLFLYSKKENILKLILKKDIRKFTGKQGFVNDAPINLIYVADFERIGNSSIESKKFYSATDTGFISQNVYLFCASEGLATVVRGWVNREKLRKIMELEKNQKIILSQTVGYPAE